MSDIFEDIVKDVEINPSKSKIIIKWLLRATYVLIGVAFLYGSYRMHLLSKLNDMEKDITEVKLDINEIKSMQKERFDKFDAKIDKIYNDGYQAFDDFQQFNKKQLEIIVDYGQNNKDLVKKMLDVSMTEKTRNVENQLQQAKTSTINKSSISIKENIDYKNILTSVAKNTHDTIFSVIGATKSFVDKIDKKKYKIKSIQNSQKYSELFDVTFENK